jgi:DNA-binding NtrC family response regulator
VLHDWPGNVREVLNVAERLSVVKPSGPWMAEDLDEILSVAPPVGSGRGLRSSEERGSPSRSRFEERECRELEQVLAAHRWNVSAAARSLGISRGALRGRMTRLGLV